MFDTQEIRIRGGIGEDVTELKRDRNGNQYCRLSVCVTRTKNSFTWYQVNVYGETGKYLIEKERIKKGFECIVMGKHSATAYIDKRGAAKISESILADTIMIQPRLITKAQEKDLEKANKIDEEISDEMVMDLDEAPF